MKKQYAVITGATSVLGNAVAFELAKREINLILISLPQDGLEDNVPELKAFGIDVRFYETDLTLHQNLAEVTQWINLNFDVPLLINNSGTSGSKRLRETDSDCPNTWNQLNEMSISLLTRALLPNLMRQRKSYILNVSSVTGFGTKGYKTVRPISGAFANHFTKMLYQELKNTNVFVSVVHAGPMLTNIHVHDAILFGRIFGRIGSLTPERFAEVSIRQLFKRDRVILLGIGNEINRLFLKVMQIWIRLPLRNKVVERGTSNGSVLRRF